MPDIPNLIGEVFGEQNVIASLGMDVKIIYRGYSAYIDELYVNDDGDLLIALTNSQGEHTTVNAGHVEGERGLTGYIFTPSVDDNGNISWTNNGELPNPQTKNIKGQKGDPGTSPKATVTRTTDGATLVVIDDDGTTTASLHDGYHIGSIAMTGGSTMPGQIAEYTMYLNDTSQTPVSGKINIYNGNDGTGTGDMSKNIYDTNNDGVVNAADNALKLGGELPSYYAAADDIPTAVSELTNDSGYITTETDPTVPSWAKQPNKPTYTASEVSGALTAADIADKADLVDGKIPATQLPSYVDDVIEYSTVSDFPATGESGKIYVATTTNLTYRWSGTEYVIISSSLALGETSSTAYRGDRGKTAYDHSQTTGNPHDTTAADVGALAVDATAADSNKLGGTVAAQYAKLTDIAGKQDVPARKTALPASGTALDDNAYYIVVVNVGTYQFVAPSTWAHGFFTTTSSPNITFDTDATFVGSVPEFSGSTQYEFDVYLNTWVFAEVVSE